MSWIWTIMPVSAAKLESAPEVSLEFSFVKQAVSDVPWLPLMVRLRKTTRNCGKYLTLKRRP
jgi:hypothetical protein